MAPGLLGVLTWVLVPGDGVLRLDLSLSPRVLRLPTIAVRSNVAIRGLESAEPSDVLDPTVSAPALRNGSARLRRRRDSP